MVTTSTPESDPLKPGAVAYTNDDDAAKEHDDPETAIDDGEVDEEEGEESAKVLAEVDAEAIKSVVENNDDDVLVASKIIPAERGYTIEELQNGDRTAWEKASERFLKIAVYKYRDVVTFYLPGVDEDDAKSAVGEIIPDLCNNILSYPSLPQLDAAFRTALRHDISSLQRKYLSKKRGEGKTDASSELHGLGLQDAPVDQQTHKDEDKISALPKNTAQTLEDKINREYGGWSVLKSEDASESANTVDRKKLMSEAMDELNPTEKQMIELSVIGGLKQREIADKMGKNVKQIGVELIRIKKKLKKRMNEKMLTEMKNLV